MLLLYYITSFILEAFIILLCFVIYMTITYNVTSHLFFEKNQQFITWDVRAVYNSYFITKLHRTKITRNKRERKKKLNTD